MAFKTLEIVYSILDQVKGQAPTDDVLLEESWIIAQMNQMRALLIKSEYERIKGLSDEFYQSVCCLEVKCREIECGGYGSGDKQFYVELPEMPGGIMWADIKYLGLTDFKTGFERLSLTGWQNRDGNYYSYNMPGYMIMTDPTDSNKQNAILTMSPTSGLKYLCAIGVFKNASGLCDAVLQDEIFPIPDYLVHQLELLVIKQIGATTVFPPDTVNDTSDFGRQPNKQPNIPLDNTQQDQQ